MSGAASSSCFSVSFIFLVNALPPTVAGSRAGEVLGDTTNHGKAFAVARVIARNTRAAFANGQLADGPQIIGQLGALVFRCGFGPIAPGWVFRVKFSPVAVAEFDNNHSAGNGRMNGRIGEDLAQCGHFRR